MKNIIILFLFISSQIFPQVKSIQGIVKDSESKSPLQNANVLIKGTSIGTTSDEDGRFVLSGKFSESDTILISFVGYKNYSKQISQLNEDQIIVELQKIYLQSQTILVEASVGKKGITPIAFDKINKDEIQKDYVVQDVPNYLSQLPSTTFYSENGNGIGYNYLSIRGFDQRRISVSINGIPQNDPEDHNVYWLDFPDLLASTELIQVQRGAGSGVVGYPAVGGSINIITSPFSEKPQLSLSASYGSFNTKKYSASFSSGLINNKYSIYAKLSQIQSSGYRDLSWAKLNSYHLSAVRYDDKLTTQFNFYGGPISDGLAYTGVAKFAVKDLNLRKQNFSYWEANANKYIYTLDRKPTEIENFSQPHFELLNEYQLNKKIKFNSALFLVIGSGFFDYDGSWAIPAFGYDDYFRLKSNGYDSTMIPTNALIRAQVENKQFGWIPKFSFDHSNGNLVIGGEFRIHRSEHFGNIIFAENLPAGVTKDYQYYFYNGAKNIFSGFVHESYNLTNEINLLGELQLAYHKYEIFNEKYLGNDFSVDDLFLNPRVGINYKFSERQNVFLSFARVTREPRLKNYYDAAESSGGETPQFELNNNGTYNFNSPLVKPETMNDLEIGTSFNNDFFSLNLNLYYMLFENEIVKNGKVDRFGQPITGNVDQTTHIGFEISSVVKILNGLELFGNASYSKNKITNGKYFISETESIDISNNSISGFPEFLFNLGLQYNHNNIFIKLNAKYVGKFYSDNFDGRLSEYLIQFPGFIDYTDNINDAYFTMDLFTSYEVNLLNSLTNSKIFIQVNSVFDNLYSAYAIGKEFFPAAERNFIAGIQVGL
ncbi:MAG: TonB-dependent receptor [Ignavibacteriaceae bacterium]|nr:TonB-dependent receptor [Ignavibacterium sp.]MCC6255858.1 TonB-dependent receptor [Ignavibacteriaceae bacterium]HRP93538.1 TonB-dependent receptor [Ignavibacteriaceae bacterium]